MGEDMDLPRLFYKLPELTQKWQKTQDDILQMAAADELKLSIKYHGSVSAPTQGGNVEVSSHYLQLLPHDILKVLTTHGKADYYRIDIAKLNGELVYTLNVYEPGTIESRKQNTPPLYIFGYEDLFILTDEVARVEKIYPELINLNAETSPESDDDFVETNKEIKLESGLSFNTFKKYADLAGIPIETIDGKNRVSKSNIRRVVQFRKKY